MAFVRADDQASREELCRLLLNNLEKNQKPSPEDIERFVRVNCLSTSGMPADLQKRALELARLAETNNMPHPLPHWFALSLGIAEYRAGQYERAIELLHKAEQGKDSYGAQFTCRNEAMVFEALALKHLGREREARKILAQAHDSLAEPMKHRSLYNWRDLDYCKLALDEANKVFDKPASPGRKPPEPDSLPTWPEPTSSVWW
jgi:tetratricopeptide (TPR) repeat protein